MNDGLKAFYNILIVLFTLTFSGEFVYGFQPVSSKDYSEISSITVHKSTVQAVNQLTYFTENNGLEISTIEQTEILPLLLDFNDSTSNFGVLTSEYLSRIALQKAQTFGQHSFNKFRIKEILFPFHSFW